MRQHSPVRPEWSCTCGELRWPCFSEKARLGWLYDGTLPALGIYLSGFLVEALADMPERPEGAVYAQILGWIRG